MTALPSARQHRIHKLEHGRRGRTRGVVIHVMDGTVAGTLSWWARSANVKGIGAHVCVNAAQVVQTADLDAICYHAPGDNEQQPGLQLGNSEFVGIEHEGTGTMSSFRWLSKPRMLMRSANRTAWILHHYKCGEPKWRKNVVRHSAFSRTSHSNCPGKHFPYRTYMRLVKRAYKKLKKTHGRSWG